MWLLRSGYGGAGASLRAALRGNVATSTTGGIGLNLSNIRTTIRKKNEKAANYDWRFVDEKWLLIVAACDNTLSEHAGPPEEWKWNDSELRTLCRASPFDRIYFWERGAELVQIAETRLSYCSHPSGIAARLRICSGHFDRTRILLLSILPLRLDADQKDSPIISSGDVPAILSAAVHGVAHDSADKSQLDR